MNWQGQQGQSSFDFSPAKPTWEVASIASSPTNVTKCPPTARCFAVGSYGTRTPFVVVDPADSASCDATVNHRIDLGCFDASTKIRMADGTDKEIKLLEEQDRILNPITQKSVAIKRVTRGPEKHPLLSIQTADGLVKVTSKHPFLSVAGLKQADELLVGDKIIDSKGNLQSILSIQKGQEAPQEWVWNFELDTESKEASDHAILANGIVTGDLYLQEHLARQKAGYLTLLNP